MKKKSLAQRIKKIKLLVLDVDGILTDGKIVLDHEGRETKHFDVKDGFGLVLLKRAGLKTAIISARSSPALTARAKDLNIDKIYQDAFPKIEAYRELLKEFHLNDDDVCFMGDDLPDREVLLRVGLAATVPSAVTEIKKSVHYVTKKDGGAGAVREIIELILKTQGLWKNILQKY